MLRIKSPSKWNYSLMREFFIKKRHAFDSSTDEAAWSGNLCIWVFVFLIWAHVFAGLALRGLFSDGIHYFMVLLQTERFQFFEPQRLFSQILQQVPLLAYLKYGGSNLYYAGQIYSVCLNTFPFLIFFASFFIPPPEQRVFAWFPMLVCFAFVTSSSSAAVADGNFAASYFWMLLLGILFRATTRWRYVVYFLSVPLFLFHEGMAILGPLLSIATLDQMRKNSRQANGLRILAGWYELISILSWVAILWPRSYENRNDLLANWLKMMWLYIPYEGVNVQAVLGLLAVFAIIGIIRTPRFANAMTAAFAAVGLLLSVSSFYFGALQSPRCHFVSRYNAIAASFAIGSALLLIMKRQDLRPRVFRSQILLVLLFTGFYEGLSHFASAADWIHYTNIFRNEVTSHVGYIEKDSFLRGLSEKDRSIVIRNSWDWTNPEMSMGLSQNGFVISMIGNGTNVSQQPFDPRNPLLLPRTKWIDTSFYVSSLKNQSDP